MSHMLNTSVRQSTPELSAENTTPRQCHQPAPHTRMAFGSKMPRAAANFAYYLYHSRSQAKSTELVAIMHHHLIRLDSGAFVN